MKLQLQVGDHIKIGKYHAYVVIIKEGEPLELLISWRGKAPMQRFYYKDGVADTVKQFYAPYPIELVEHLDEDELKKVIVKDKSKLVIKIDRQTMERWG